MRRAHSFSFRLLSRLTGILLAVSAALAPCGVAAPDGVDTEYQRKATQIAAFTKFIDWPAKKFAAPDSPFIIGVVGSDEITGYLRESFQGRRIKDRPVEIRNLATKAELAACHVVFISRSERDRIGPTLLEVKRQNILTVGESDNFLRSGGVINFVIQNGIVRYQVDINNARRERLVISSQLLQYSLPPDFRPADARTAPPVPD